jgi:hypothetical protein
MRISMVLLLLLMFVNLTPGGPGPMALILGHEQ